MISIFLLLLLPLQAGEKDREITADDIGGVLASLHANFIKVNGPLPLAVMSRQQAEKPDSFRVVYVGNNAVYNKELLKLRTRVDSLEARLSRAHIDSVCVIKHAGWRYYKLTGEPYWYKGAVYWKHIISFDPEGK